jgi:hypothetical protein
MNILMAQETVCYGNSPEHWICKNCEEQTKNAAHRTNVTDDTQDMFMFVWYGHSYAWIK